MNVIKSDYSLWKLLRTCMDSFMDCLNCLSLYMVNCISTANKKNIFNIARTPGLYMHAYFSFNNFYHYPLFIYFVFVKKKTFDRLLAATVTRQNVSWWHHIDKCIRYLLIRCLGGVKNAFDCQTIWFCIYLSTLLRLEMANYLIFLNLCCY